MEECKAARQRKEAAVNRPQCDLAPYLPPFRQLAPSGARAVVASLCHFAIRRVNVTGFKHHFAYANTVWSDFKNAFISRRCEAMLGFKI